MPRVSVIVPAYNAERFLAATLQSACASTYRDFEVVVVDDGSSDATAAVAEAFAPTVRVIRQSNRGMSASRNRAVQDSDSEFVALLDADDLWHPRKLELQIDAMDREPEAGLCFSEFVSWDGASPVQFPAEPALLLDERLSGWIYHQMLLTNFVLPSSALLRRTVFNDLGLFKCDNQKTDDWEYFVRASRSYRFIKLAAALVAYRQSPASLSRTVRTIDDTEVMRAQLIDRFGLVSPQGVAVDPNELARRRYKARRDFADTHLAQGHFRLGLSRFTSLLLAGPHRVDSLETLFKSAMRRLRFTVLRGQ